MDLKDFIVETISGIIDAADHLQATYEEKGVIVNPPIAHGSEGKVSFEENSSSHYLRRVHNVEFDVAVTASDNSQAGGKAGLRVFSIEAGVEGSHGRLNQEVSRVRFSIPLTLSASAVEKEVRTARDMESVNRPKYKATPKV